MTKQRQNADGQTLDSVSLYIPADLKGELLKIAKRDMIPLSAVIRQAGRDYVARRLGSPLPETAAV